ncbi:hypothetical protein ABIC30_006346 [Methylobacterium sp. 1030]
MIAIVGGTPLRKPTARVDRPKLLMICGAQMPSV